MVSNLEPGNSPGPPVTRYLWTVPNNDYHQKVPDHNEFMLERLKWIREQTRFERGESIDLVRSAVSNKFEYMWTWLGAPVIRFPEDLMLQQELLAERQFHAVIETGVARAGGVLFSASILRLKGSKAPVIGVDNIIHPHAYTAIESSSLSEEIKLVEGDSVAPNVVSTVRELLSGLDGKFLVVLDSDHSTEHVLEEMRLYGELCKKGSVMLVCDTVIDELGEGHFPGRSWNSGFGPGKAVGDFLSEESSWEQMDDFSRRGLISEIRDGIIEKIRD